MAARDPPRFRTHPLAGTARCSLEPFDRISLLQESLRGGLLVISPKRFPLPPQRGEVGSRRRQAETTGHATKVSRASTNQLE